MIQLENLKSEATYKRLRILGGRKNKYSQSVTYVCGFIYDFSHCSKSPPFLLLQEKRRWFKKMVSSYFFIFNADYWFSF